MINCVTLTDGDTTYQVTIPGEMLRESDLLLADEPYAPLADTELAIESPNLIVKYDSDERTLTYHLPEPPEETPEPKASSKPLTRGERAVLSKGDD